MDAGQFNELLARFDKPQVFNYLVNVNGELTSGSEIELFKYTAYLSQLTSLIEKFNVEAPTKSKKVKDATESEANALLADKLSLNIFRLVSRNLVLIFVHLPTKVYDMANSLLNNLTLNDSGELSPISEISIVILIDLYEGYPNSLSSLVNYSVTQIYKIIKKSPSVNSSLVFLLNSITKNATKADIDEKFQAKLLKIVTKNITSIPIQYQVEVDSTETETSSVLLKKNYVLCLKNLLLLSVSTNYENLLAMSTSSSSAGSKLKPESLMAQQHAFQTNLLNTHEKLFYYCLANFSQEIRISTIEMLANLFINFVPAGKFNPIEYLVTSYIMPPLNCWDVSLTVQYDPEDLDNMELRKDANTVTLHDSEGIIQENTEMLIFQTSIVETMILYIQLEQFQNTEYLSTNLVYILDIVLARFSELNQIDMHLQNQQWNKVLSHWKTFIDYVIKESGSNCHEILTGYVYSKFNLSSGSTGVTSEYESHSSSGPSISKGKRENALFNFKSKSSTKSRNKDLRNKEVRAYHNSYQTYLLLFIVELLLPYGINFNSIVRNKDEEINSISEQQNAPSTNTENDDEDDEFEEQTARESSFIRDILLKLIINNNSYIRNYALKTLLHYARYNEVEINQLILQTFRLVNQEYKSSENEKDTTNDSSKKEENICGLASIRLLSFSLVLSSLIKQTEWRLLQNATIVKILSFCTQNLKHNNNNNRSNFLKNSACWVILSSLVTFYNESEFVKLNSSQFLVFWKGLLTSQFISSSAGSVSEAGQRLEIVDNLKLRNSSLVCLLNYLNSVELTPESLRQIQFLLTKSYNYLSYLESNIEVVGSVTNFNGQNFNESEYNPNLINNLQYSNYAYNNKLSFEKTLISLILYGKKIILHSFHKLAAFLKNDINSNMVIFLLKVFSDTKVFSRLYSIEDKTKASKKNISPKISDNDESSIILSEDYNYSFGITSKFQDYTDNIDELLTKFPIAESTSLVDGLYYNDSFTKTSIPLPKVSIETETKTSFNLWIDYFEKLIFTSVDHSINYDPSIFLIQDYSSNSKYSTTLLASLVDLSIELFQLVFPYLSLKIQFSLSEQLRNSLTAKSIDPLRLRAVEVNTAVALHGTLNNIVKKRLNLDKEVVDVFLDILAKIESKNANVLSINADTVALAAKVSSKEYVTELINKYVNNIVTNASPIQRGYSILILSKIYKQTHYGFSDIYNIALQLLKDPSPVVYHYSLSAMIILFQNNIDNLSFIPSVLDRVYFNYLNDNFSYDVKNKLLSNLKCKYRSIGLTTELFRLFVTSLGPSLRDWTASDKTYIKNVIMALSQGIGLATAKDYVEVFRHLLGLFQELIIFDPKLIDGEIPIFSDLLNLIISKNLKIGLASVSPTSLHREAIFPFNTSYDLYRASYECYVELLKIFGTNVLSKESVSMLWVSMNIKPCPELKQFIQLWLESSLDSNWFVILSSLFRCSSKKLIGPFIELNYQQKLLPLSQRQKKKAVNSVDFKDEEIENIVGDGDDESDKNEPITWEFKLFIYDLLNHLLELSSKNSQLYESLKSKIPDIVKISFLGSTSPITDIKLRGINLLDKALGLFGHLPDPLYPGVSILEQQQAQIISALIPCFTPGNDSRVIVNTINVCSKFISLPRIKFYSKQRILKTLIYLLEEISSNKFLKFSFLEDMSENGRKSIQLSILNCWALLKIDASEDPDAIEKELLEILDKYATLLTSLWIFVLREYSSLKYNESSHKELEIYGSYWINFISVLSMELERDSSFVDEYLGDDAQNFFFVLFSQCVESLIRNKNVSEILVSLKRLVNNPGLVDLLFNNEIFGEVIDLFDRLILIDDDTEVQVKLVDIIANIFETYLKTHPGYIDEGFDKLFELIRVGMLPLFVILPFLRADYDPSNESQQLSLKHADSAPNLLVLKKTLERLVEMMSGFADVVKTDLYACLFYIFAKIYQSKNKLLISVIMPHLKQIVTEAKSFDSKSVETFRSVISDYYQISSEQNYSVITTIILLTSGDVKLTEKDSKDVSSALIGLLESSASASIGLQCIKSLVSYSSRLQVQIPAVKYLITDLIKILGNGDHEESKLDPKIGFEILFLFTKHVTDNSRSVALYSILIPLLARYGETSSLSKGYLHERLLFLVKHDPQSFKAVVTSTLSNTQKSLIEELVKQNPDHTGLTEASGQPAIKLKTFGAE
ncbi:uncharacterized protein RJT20DRAFT_128177 [Scheffersomyces xylosifermentans]|uniref:uncharacterized protein n=1 Tax=Scheffersomyces xylosifermentans TaxID=1304137 RepID=UPI00315CB8D1